jgi:chorismate mutase
MGLQQLRKAIDRVDARIVALLNRRARYALRIGREKRTRGDPVVDPAREHAVLRRVIRMNAGPLSPSALKGIYRTIVEACARIQEDD